MFKHEPCECAPDICLKQVDPPGDCTNRLVGVVEAARCDKCDGETVHHNGDCLRCQRLDRMPQAGAINPLKKGETASASRIAGLEHPVLSLTVKLGDGDFQVTNKRKVARILKILLED